MHLYRTSLAKAYTSAQDSCYKNYETTINLERICLLSLYKINPTIENILELIYYNKLNIILLTMWLVLLAMIETIAASHHRHKPKAKSENNDHAVIQPPPTTLRIS